MVENYTLKLEKLSANLKRRIYGQNSHECNILSTFRPLRSLPVAHGGNPQERPGSLLTIPPLGG